MSFALNIQTADDLAAQAQAARRELIKAECRRRIFDVVDGIAQVNLAAAAAASVLTEGQMQTYRAGLAWVAGMRAACLPLIADADADYTGDAAWPDLPDGVADLATGF